ncbi:MAG: hypothetical protein AB1894_08090 [Chloroflexota bacterium]
MNKKNLFKTALLLIAALAICLGTAVFYKYLFAWLFPLYAYEYPVSETLEYYAIEPDSLLDSLSQGKKDAFVFETTTPYGPSGSRERTVNWGQTEFLAIANAFHEFILQEPVEDWTLHLMQFRVDCDNIYCGFDLGSFEYYKVMRLDGEETRLVHKFTISALDNSILSIRKELQPAIEKWESIDLDRIKIDAEGALLIAGKYGLDAARTTDANKCTIYLSVAPQSGYDGWRVSYSGAPETKFEIRIDPFRGEYSVVKPKKR